MWPSRSTNGVRGDAKRPFTKRHFPHPDLTRFAEAIYLRVANWCGHFGRRWANARVGRGEITIRQPQVRERLLKVPMSRLASLHYVIDFKCALNFGEAQLEKCDIRGGASAALAPTESLMAFLRAVITGDRMPSNAQTR
jgi:hypothetical protein